jgi:ribosomal protein L12E/L44/L45/RPP1/RPP2
MLFAKALKSADVNELLTNIASAPAAGAGPVAAGAAEVVADKVEEKAEVEVVDMGGLFGDDDEY